MRNKFLFTKNMMYAILNIEKGTTAVDGLPLVYRSFIKKQPTLWREAVAFLMSIFRFLHVKY